jgi:hypothetical protein
MSESSIEGTSGALGISLCITDNSLTDQQESRPDTRTVSILVRLKFSKYVRNVTSERITMNHDLNFAPPRVMGWEKGF